MYCMNCGTQNNDTSQFCAKCGKPLSSSSDNKPAAAPQPAAAQPAAAQPAAASQAAAAPQPAAAPQAAAPQPSVQPAVGSSFASAAPAPEAPEGVIGAAWKDITNSPGWAKRVLMLCLIGCVPIMNFAVDGYCLRWARELSFGKRESLPKKLFKKKEISTGFFAFLMKFALGFALGLVTYAATSLIVGILSLPSVILGTVIGVILSIAVFFFTLLVFNPCVDAAVMRMSVVGYLESGFNFKDVWNAAKRKLGTLVGASVLPRIIVGIIESIIIAIIIAITVAVAAAVGAGAYHGISNGYYPSYYNSNPLAAIDGIAGLITGAATIVIFFIIVIYILASMFNVFSTLLTYRAVGHWVARTAPEWASESDEGIDLDEDDEGSGFGF